MVIRNFFDVKDIGPLRSEVINFTNKFDYTKYETASFHQANNKLKKLIFNLENLIFKQLIFKISNFKKFKPIPNPAWWIQKMLYLKKPHSRPNGVGTKLHQDNPIYSRSNEWYTCWIPLTDANLKKGFSSLMFLPYKTSLPIPIRDFDDRRINSIEYRNFDLFFRKFTTNITAKPGDIIVFGRNMIHSTSINSKSVNTRYSIDLRWELGSNCSNKI